MRHSSVAVTALLALAADTTTAATLKSTGTPAHAPSVTVAPCAQVSNAWAATHTGKNNRESSRCFNICGYAGWLLGVR